MLLPDNIKRVVIQMVWDPIRCVVYLAGIMVVWFLVLTISIQILSKFARVKIHLFHSYSIAIWSALPWFFFIPVSMILYRVLESDVYYPWVLSLVLLMLVWVYLRALKGISVIYHIYTPKMYLIGLVIAVVALSALYVYWDYAFSLTAYAEYFLTTILPSAH